MNYCISSNPFFKISLFILLAFLLFSNHSASRNVINKILLISFINSSNKGYLSFVGTLLLLGFTLIMRARR